MTCFFMAVNIITGLNLFAKTYGGPRADYPWSIIHTSDGDYAIAARTQSYGEKIYCFVLRINPDMSLDWAETIGTDVGTHMELAYDIIQTSDAGFAVAGAASTWSTDVNYRDCLVFRLNSDGSLDWAKTFGGPYWDEAKSVIQTSDGGYAVVGFTYSTQYSTSADLFVLKLMSDGSLDWAKTFGGSNADFGNSIIQTSDGGYAIAGRSASSSAGGYDLFIIKLNSDGSQAWAKTFGGWTWDEAWSIIQTSDGGYIVVGQTLSSGAGSDDCCVLKLNPDGSRAWMKTFGGTNSDMAYSIIQTSDGGYAIAGETWSFGVGNDDCLVFKLNPDGSLSWAKTFGGPAGDEAYSIIQSADGTYTILGYTDSFGAGMADLLVFKVGPDGGYPDCVADCILTEMSVNPSSSNHNYGTDWSPSVSTPPINVAAVSPATTDVCEPVYEDVEEIGFTPKSGITCSFVPGGLLFISTGELPLKIHSADGKVVYSGNLRKGDNRIDLKVGVYFWGTGIYRGKAVVR